MEWRVTKLWYGKGEMDCLSLNHKLSDLEGKVREYDEETVSL